MFSEISTVIPVGFNTSKIDWMRSDRPPPSSPKTIRRNSEICLMTPGASTADESQVAPPITCSMPTTFPIPLGRIDPVLQTEHDRLWTHHRT